MLEKGQLFRIINMNILNERFHLYIAVSYVHTGAVTYHIVC